MPAVDGKDSCEATGSPVGVRIWSRVHRQWLSAADQEWLRLAVRVQLLRVRFGTSHAGARCAVGGVGGDVALVAAAGTAIQLAGVGAVVAGAAGSAPCRA